jgi:hypothetical protein
MREYLSNHYAGPCPRFQSHFLGQDDLADRRAIARLEEQYPAPRLRALAICQLHECDSNLFNDPCGSLQRAQFGLALALKTKDPDLISWAQSGMGAHQQILTYHQEALRRLDIARRLAVSPYQKADANRRHANLTLALANDDPKALRRALRTFAAALTTSANAPKRINSDRGYTAILLDKAVGHLRLGARLNDDSSHYNTAKDLLKEVLDTACPLHARRSRRMAIYNLVLHHLKLDRTPPRSLVERLKAYPVAKSSFDGAIIQWVLIFDQIRAKGYNRSFRRRLITVRKHLKDNDALDYAEMLTLAIAALDASRETEEGSHALTFLRDSREFLTEATVVGEQYMCPAEIMKMARNAGAGDVFGMVSSYG